MLSKRNYPSPIMRQKLKAKGISSEAIDVVITYCIEKGFIDDDYWIQNFVQKELEKNGPYTGFN